MKISKVPQVCDGFLIGKTSPNRTIFSGNLVLCVFSLESFTGSYYMKYESVNADARRKALLGVKRTTDDYGVVQVSRKH